MNRSINAQDVRKAVSAALTQLRADRHLGEPLEEADKTFSKREEDRVTSLVRDELKGKATEDLIVKVAKRVLTNFAKAIWTRRSFWQQGIDSRSESQEGTRSDRLLSALLERDDIGKLPLSRDAKAYARLKGGVKALKKKVGLFVKVNAELTNPGMKNRFVSGQRRDTTVTHTGKFKPKR